MSSPSSSCSGEDRLSLLPDELLHHILSFIPSTKFHTSTSLLSKRWRRLWTHHANLHLSMPFLDSDDMDSIAKPYVLSVNRCLRIPTSSSPNSVSLDLWLPTARLFAESKTHSKVAERWLRLASLRSARELSVSARSDSASASASSGRVPGSLFSCRSLACFPFSFSAFSEVLRKFRGFRNRTSLCVSSGLISDNAVADLLDGCPLLEDLRLIRCVGLRHVEISPQGSPRLKHLVPWTSFYFEKGNIEASIDALNLRSIVFGRNVSNLNWKGPVALTEAKLSHDSEDGFESFEHWMKICLPSRM